MSVVCLCNGACDAGKQEAIVSTGKFLIAAAIVAIKSICDTNA